MKARAFSIILLFFVLGIFVAPLISFELGYLIYLILGFLLVAFYFRKNIYIRTVFIIFAVFFGAILRYEAIQPMNKDNWIGDYNGEKVEIVGVVDSEPESDKVTRYIVDPISLNGEKGVTGKVLLTIFNFPRYEFGDKVKITGELKEPQEFEDFSYKDYLSKSGVYSTIDFQEVEKTKSQYVERSFTLAVWFRIKLILSDIKNRFEESIERLLPEPHASFMDGLILGVKKSIPEWLMDDFSITGTTHIIALSGFNITIIVQIFRNLTKGLSRRLSFWLPISGVFLFVVLTGAQASVVRAAVMGSMLLLARRLGRQSTAYTAIVLTAAVMIYLNPLILRFDIGFQLSFAAVMGLIYISPIFEKAFVRLPNIINENLSLTLAAQVAAAPIIIYNFESFSVIAPLSNILILPLIPFTMLFGFLAATFGMVSGVLGNIFGWIAYGMLEYMIRSVGYLAEVPYASLNIDVTSPIYIFIYYLIIIDILFMIRFKQKRVSNEK